MEPVRIEFLMVDKLSGRLAQATGKMEQLTGKTSQARRQVEELDKAGLSLQKTIGKVAAAFTIREVVSKIATVRGEFQQLEVAFETMLGSAEKAKALMSQLTQTAATTPFGLEDVAQGAKQLLAYGFEAEKVNETLIRLGDIAAGLSVPLNDLVYLYGTTMAQGRLYTQDLNQFTGRGIPMIGELARQFGVAESKVKELVEEGKVGFPEVQKVIESLTDEGGKFGGLMEAQSKTITGQISNIEDAISMMFNELGQQSEGVINTTLSGVSHVIENYERFGRILLGLVGTYGVYRTAVMTVAAAKGWATAAEMLHYNWLLLVEKAQKLLNATMLANPYVLVATLIAGVVAAMVSMKTEAERLKEAEEAYQAQKQKVIEAEEEHRRKMEELCAIAGNEAVATDTRREALNKLEQKYPDIFAKYDTEYEKLKNIKKIKEEIALLDGQKSVTNPANELKGVEERIKELEVKKSTERWVDANGSGTRMRKTGGLSRDEETELKNLLGKRESLNGQIRKNEVNAYFENLTGISNETLAQQIRQRETLLANMTMQEKKYGKITQGNAALTGTYSRDELQYQLNKLRSEQNRRNLPKDSSSDWAASAGKRYRDALKEYNDFIKDTSNNLTQEEFEKKTKELKDAVDTAKKEYDKVKPGTDSDAEKARKAGEKREREEEKRRQTSEKLGQELAELQRENDAAEIEAMDEGLQKKLRQIDNDYQARKNEIDKQEADWKRKNKEAGQGGELSDGQQSAIDKANELNEEKRKRSEKDAYAEELAAMREYLKEYGSFEQRKLAITEEYAEKIRKAGSAGERLTLEKEKRQALSSLSFESISAGIDWKALFSGVDTLSKEMLEPMMERLQAYARTDEYREADAQTQQQVAELIQELRKYTGTDRSVTWQTLVTAMSDFTASVDTYNKALAAEKEAVARREESKRRLDAGEITEAEYQQAADNARLMGDATAKAREDMEGFGTTLNDTSEQVANFVSGLTATLNNAKAWAGVEGFSGVQQSVENIDAFKGALDSALPTMGDGMAKTLTSGLSSTLGSGLSSLGSGLGGILTSGIGQVVGFAAQVPRLILDLVSSVKSFVTGVLDSLTELISLRWIDDLVVSILDAVGNLVDAIFDLPENLFHVLSSIVVDGVGGLLDTVVGRVGNILSFGALGSGGPSEWFTNSNAKEVQETIDRLTERNELLQTAIEDLTEEMENARGAEAIRISRDAVSLQEQTNANYLQMAQAQSGYHGSHHSWGYYWGGFTQEEIARLSGQIGRSWDGSLWSLSPEEMKTLRSNVDIWERIQGTGKGGYGERLTDKLDDYIEQAGKLEELTATLYENLTTTTKENVFDDFLESLYNLADGSEDVMDDIAENWQSMVNRMAVNNLVGAKFQKQLEDWYEELAQLNESRTNGEISDAEYKRRLDALQREYERYVEQAQGDIESLREAGIIKETGEDSGGTSQSAKTGGFSAMTQDQGTKLEGMFTSGLQHWSSMDERLEDVAGKMSAAENHLAKIEENTGTSAKHLDTIKEDIKKMIRDGIKLR